MTRKEISRRYYKKHRKEILARSKRHHEKYREKELARARRYYEGHKEEMLAHQKRYRKEQKKEISVRRRKRYLAHPEKTAIQVAAWVRANRKRARLNVNRYHAKRRAVSGNFTIAEWNLLLVIFAFRCAYCWQKGLKLGIDHVVPVSKGGTSFIENVLPSCLSCNSRKGNKLFDKLPFFGPLIVEKVTNAK